MNGAVKESRTAVMIVVEASWLDLSGVVQSVTARMENHSAHGACIRMKARVAVGKRVYIQSHREQFSGIAKYCRMDGKEFLVGIHRDSVSVAAPRKPAPANVLTPQTAREEPRPSEGAATPVKLRDGPRQRANAQSEIRDAEWSAARRPEPRRERVPHRGKGHNGHSGHAGHIARVEEPIAGRVREPEGRSRESASSCPPASLR